MVEACAGGKNQAAVPGKDDVLITPYRDGPLLIRGPVTLLDDSGEKISSPRNPVALCRCGKSRIRPFCGDTHKLVGFRAPAGAEVRLTDPQARIYAASAAASSSSSSRSSDVFPDRQASST
jgi:CDGSH-type Zn-finger protein